MEKMKCPNCGHEWIKRVENPRKCPKCKHYLPKNVTETKLKKEEGEK